MPSDTEQAHSLWKSRGGMALLIFGAIAAFFLFTEHRAHVFGLLPYALLLACPLLHLFGHGGHGSHRHGSDEHDASEHKNQK